MNWNMKLELGSIRKLIWAFFGLKLVWSSKNSKFGVRARKKIVLSSILIIFLEKLNKKLLFAPSKQTYSSIVHHKTSSAIKYFIRALKQVSSRAPKRAILRVFMSSSSSCLSNEPLNEVQAQFVYMMSWQRTRLNRASIE